MPFTTVKLRPGVNIEATPVLNEAGYSTGSLGRFKSGLFQKIGGWIKFYQFVLPGIIKALHPWQDLNNSKHLAVGTTSLLGIITDTLLNTITPQTLVSDFAPNFTTISGQADVEITDPNISNVTTFDSVFFNTPIAVGGLILTGLYPITSITGTNSYKITAATLATSSVSNGGAVPTFTTTSGSPTVTVNLTAHGQVAGNTAVFPVSTTGAGVTIVGAYTEVTISSADAFTIITATQATSSTTFSMNGGNAELVYYISLGPPATGTGYGLGGYGDGGYGTGIVPSSQTGVSITALDWSLDNFGQLLVASPKNGGIYYYDPSGGFTNASLVPNAPIFNGGMFVAMPEQQIVAWGSTTPVGLGVQQDPLLVKWCDVGDFTTWIASANNQAGSYRLSTGSMIVGAIQGSQNGLLFTDLDVWAMSYIGAPLVYGFNKIGSGCGLVGQHGVCQLSGSVFWMGRSNFFTLGSGGVIPIPCTVWDAVFQDLDVANITKCVAAASTPFDEVIFYYPSLSGGTGENDKYAKLNTIDGTWDNGPLPRSAWTDQSVLGQPIGSSPQSIVYQHELTNDADGSPINPVMQTGYWTITEGSDLAFVDWIFPDFKWGTYAGSQNAQIQVTIYAINYPDDTPQVFGPYTVTMASPYINVRIRARFMAMNIQSSDVGSFWRLGAVKLRFAIDGRR